jgi:phenylacetate 2-hydroxylase
MDTEKSLTMDSPWLLALVSLISVYIAAKILNYSDIPKIRGIPEVPGVPIFGNLLQLGDSHPRVAAGWVKKYGPVFQTRLGNMVRTAKVCYRVRLT